MIYIYILHILEVTSKNLIRKHHFSLPDLQKDLKDVKIAKKEKKYKTNQKAGRYMA